MEDGTRSQFKTQQETRQHLVGGYTALADWMKCCPRSKTLEAWSQTLNAWVIIGITCKNWGCPICGRKKLAHYARRVMAAQPNRLITLTVNPRMHNDPRAAYDATRRSIPKLSERLRKGYTEFEFFRVLEATKKGWPHYHLITRCPYIPQQEISDHWKKLTGAPIVDVRKMDKTTNAYWYVVKYLGKQLKIPWTDRRASWTKGFFAKDDFEAGECLHLASEHFYGARPDNHARWEHTGCVLEAYSDNCWIIRGRTAENEANAAGDL